MIPFSYAVLDDEGKIIRKYRWSIKEAKWFKDNNPNVTLIKLKKQITTKKNLFALVGECLF